MLCETQRPETFNDIIGHDEPKRILTNYLTTKPYRGCVFLTGTAGIGKTTLALASTKVFGFEPLEINASKSIRTFTDVEKLKDSCRSSFSIQSLLRNHKQTMCVILDEVDGSDPHAQRRIIEWIRDSTRCVPIICTGNDVPIIFKRSSDSVQIVRCYPPKANDIQSLFPQIDIQSLVKECQHDIRRIIHRVQYGQSYVIPKYPVPPTGLSIEETFIRRQAMFGLPDPLGCRNDTRGSVHSS
jgi:DNA polymerase III delta prime subunit